MKRNRRYKTYPHNDTVLCLPYVWKFIEYGRGLDVGSGSNPVSPDITAIDSYPNEEHERGPDIVWDARLLDYRHIKDGHGYAGPGFPDHWFDFVYSCHVLEDFPDIKGVLNEWWRKIRVGGYLVLLLPDMEGGRYPRVDDPEGNPSHRTNVGVRYMTDVLTGLYGDKCEIVQSDTIPHEKSPSFEFVAKKIAKGGYR